MSQSADILVHNPWQTLRNFTDARIGLGRAGVSLPTQAHLAFQLAHARARDAVHLPLDFQQLQADIEQVYSGDILKLNSKASHRAEYLQRPDFGRELSDTSADLLSSLPVQKKSIVLVVADGLSSLAVQKHAVPMMASLNSALDGTKLSIDRVCLVEQGRVAIGDPIGELMQAQMLVMLIGERPGLSSPDSLGVYYTFEPQRGKHDAQRNCISNVRKEGLSYEEATHKLMYLLLESDRRQLSGVALKDESDNGSSQLRNPSSSNLLIGASDPHS